MQNRDFEAGDVVQIAPEWRDTGDEHTMYWVRQIDGDRALIEVLGTRSQIGPTVCVKVEMIEQLSPDHAERCLKFQRCL